MVTFGLVHGAYHGSWCWEKLTPQLERRGHQVLTVDLPAEDPRAGAAEYAAAALTAFGGAGDDLVVVGHSLGGLTIPLITASRPVRQLIFVAGMLPRPGKTQEEVLSAEPDMLSPGPEGGANRGPGGQTRWRPEAAARWFFADCPPDLAAWAASRLRGQCWKIASEVTPLPAWPAVPCSYVLGTCDPVISPAWSRRAAPAVLGVKAIEIDAGHSPFLATPTVMAQILDELAADPGTRPSSPPPSSR
jgi:pimeloyl-ACP methyl ester carboxylesterase